MAKASDFSANRPVLPLTATIVSSGTVSTSVSLHGTTACAFEIPSTFTGTSVTFEGSIDNGTTFKVIKDAANAAISFTVSVDGLYSLDPNIFLPYDSLKIVSNAAEGAERQIKIKPCVI